MPGLLQNKELEGAGIVWLETLRRKGREAFAAAGLPTPKTEAWKYTRLRMLGADDFVLPAEDEIRCSCGCEEGHCEHENCSCRQERPFPAYVLGFRNGFFRPPHPELPEGVEVMTLMEALQLEDEAKSRLGKLIELEKYPLAALNTAYLQEGLFINIRRGVRLDKPILIENCTHSGGQNLFFNLRHLIVVENGAEAEIIETYAYHGEPKSRYFSNIVSEIYVGRNAVLRHYKLQDEAFKACHVALAAVQVKEGGRYRRFCAQKGADVGRDESASGRHRLLPKWMRFIRCPAGQRSIPRPISATFPRIPVLNSWSKAWLTVMPKACSRGGYILPPMPNKPKGVNCIGLCC